MHENRSSNGLILCIDQIDVLRLFKERRLTTRAGVGFTEARRNPYASGGLIVMIAQISDLVAKAWRLNPPETEKVKNFWIQNCKRCYYMGECPGRLTSALYCW